MTITGLALAMALNMAALGGDAQDNARKAFNNCLVEEHNTAVAAKKSGAEFDMVVRSEKGFGSKQAEAEEYANDEIQSILDSITGAFSENVTNGARLQPEK
jgi:hypothetical protein